MINPVSSGSPHQADASREPQTHKSANPRPVASQQDTVTLSSQPKAASQIANAGDKDRDGDKS